MKEIGMRMAKATPEDLDAAILLNGMLSDVCDDDQFPRGLDGEFSESDPNYFDEDDSDHLRALYRRLREVYRRSPGGMNRVIWGMDCLMNPENRLVDPDKDHLAPHPAIRWAEAEQKAPAVEEPEATEGRGLYRAEIGGLLRCTNRKCQHEWIYTGGETQCVAAQVPFFFKQWGEWCPGHNDGRPMQVVEPGEIVTRFGKHLAGRRLDGREWSEFPATT